jgi:ribulose-phosphate 3-epimerase
MVQETKKDILLGVDGGITRDNVAEVARMGADLIVTGSAVFDGKKPRENATFMIETVRASRPRNDDLRPA